jgi:translation initiation factor 3 subunit H
VSISWWFVLIQSKAHVYHAQSFSSLLQAIRAYRLSPAFMKLRKANDFSASAFADEDIVAEDILEEIPMKIKNSHLVQGFLFDVGADAALQCDSERLNLHANPLLVKNLAMLSFLIDDNNAQQEKYQYYQRQVARQKSSQANLLQRRADENKAREATGLTKLDDADLKRMQVFKPISKPSRLEPMLISKQMSHYCDGITDTTTQTMNKLYVVESLNRGD